MNEFKKLRLAAGLSQRDVSDALGFSTPQFISNWCRDVSCPSFSNAKHLAKLYNVSPKVIADEIEKFRRNQFEMKIKREKKQAGL